MNPDLYDATLAALPDEVIEAAFRRGPEVRLALRYLLRLADDPALLAAVLAAVTPEIGAST